MNRFGLAQNKVQLLRDVSLLLLLLLLLLLSSSSSSSIVTTEADRRSACQVNSPLLWNPVVHYRVQHSCPLASMLNPVHTLTLYLSEMNFYIILPSTPIGLVPSNFPTKI
jgi:hypothetical protein